MHLDVLDNMMDFNSWFASADRAVCMVERKVGEVWAKDIQSLIDALDTMCPCWQAKRNQLLTDADLVQAMLVMPQKHVEGIGPVAQELQYYLAAVPPSCPFAWRSDTPQ